MSEHLYLNELIVFVLYCVGRSKVVYTSKIKSTILSVTVAIIIGILLQSAERTNVCTKNYNRYV